MGYAEEPEGEGTYHGHKRLGASEVGYRAPRSCTNVCCIFIYVAFWILLVVVAVAAFALGDVRRLNNGVDYAGNICSKDDTEISFTPANYNNSGGANYVVQGPQVDWKDRTSLWYPIYFSNGEFHIHDVKDLGVCVSKCPKRGERVAIYLNANANGTAVSGGSMSAYYDVLFNSTSLFHRCVPTVSTFDCEGLSNAGERTECQSLRDSANSAVDLFYSSGENMFSELANSWWIILTCAFLAIILCVIWLFALRRLVIPIVVFSIIMALVALIGTGAYLLSRSLKDKNTNHKAATLYLVAGILCFAGTLILLGVIIFFCKNILVACNIIEEGAKVPITIPTMVLVPVGTSLFIIPMAILSLFVAACTYTAASKISVDAPAPIIGDSFSNSTILHTQQYELKNWRIYANIYNLFMFLWTMGFIGAIGFMTLAFCAVFWYWSNPGDDKNPDVGVLEGLKLTFRYHIGTVAMGSFLIAVLQLLRIIMLVVEKRMKSAVEKNQGLKLILCCCQCCLACTERVLKFISENIYVMCAMTGEGFKDGGLHALGLLGRNVFSVGAVSMISEYIVFLSKVFITATVSVTGFAIYSAARGDQDHANIVLVMVIIVVMTFVIVSIFISVLGVCVTTVLLSYCYDLEINDGAAKPFFMPSDLSKLLDEHKDRAAAKQKNVKGESNSLVQPIAES